MDDPLIAIGVRSHQEGMVENRSEVIPEIFAEDFENVSPGLPDTMRRGHDSIRGHYGFLHSAFSDIAMDHGTMFSDGDFVAIAWTWHATHTGPFLGIPPTGARVRVEGYDILEIRDGKIKRAWVYQDNVGLMNQLGAGHG